MNLRQIIRRVEIEGMHVKSSDRAQQRIGCNHPVALSLNLPGPSIRQFLLRIEDIDRCALPALRLAPNPLARNAGRAYFGLRRTDRTLRSLIRHPSPDAPAS